MDVRRKLGVGPGSVLEWEAVGSRIFVRRAGRFTAKDIHQALFASRRPKAHNLAELKEGLQQSARERYARH